MPKRMVLNDFSQRLEAYEGRFFEAEGNYFQLSSLMSLVGS